MSETITAAQSIQGVMAKIGAVGKDSRNEFQNFNFRGIDAVMNAVGPALREVGGFIAPTVEEVTYEHGSSGKQGTPYIEAFVRVRYDWHGTDGGTPVTAVIAAEAMDTSDKATAKAISVAYRTYLLQILCLPTTERDPDADYIERGSAPATAPDRPVYKPAPQKPLSKPWHEMALQAEDKAQLMVVFQATREAGELGQMAPGSDTTLRDFMIKLAAELPDAPEAAEAS